MDDKTANAQSVKAETRYELVLSEIVINHKNRSLIKPGCSLFCSNGTGEVLKAKDTEELLSLLEKCKTSVFEKNQDAHPDAVLYHVKEFIAQQSVYDSSGALLKSHILGFSTLKIGVFDRDNNLMDVFDNYAAAESLSSAGGERIVFL